MDFDLQVGDTVSAVADGFVVGMVEGYTEGGKSIEWEGYANFITLFHPEMNVFTQYVHLDHNGSFVEIGEQVQEGQPIGLSGLTGFTNIPHLYFNVLKTTRDGLKSVAIKFKEGYEGIQLSEGVVVKRGPVLK